MRPEDFTISPDDQPSCMSIYCPVDGCYWAPGVGNDTDIGSLLDAARDHLTTRHPTQGPDT